MLLQTIFDLAEKRRVVFQKSGVKFKPIDTERGRHFDPIQKRHRVANTQFVYKALRKTSELRFHHSWGTWTIRLPMKLGDVMWPYGDRNSAR